VARLLSLLLAGALCEAGQQALGRVPLLGFCDSDIGSWAWPALFDGTTLYNGASVPGYLASGGSSGLLSASGSASGYATWARAHRRASPGRVRAPA